MGPEDLGNNFFLDSQSLGHSRAVRVTELLRELNDRVKGYSVDEVRLVVRACIVDCVIPVKHVILGVHVFIKSCLAKQGMIKLTNNQDPVALINTKLEFFDTYTIVVACDLPEAALRKLATYLYEHNIPLVVPRSYGFIGYLRIATPEHTSNISPSTSSSFFLTILLFLVIESKPDNPADDLRMFTPFPELLAYADSIKLEGLDSAHHSHVPYLLNML